MPLKKYTHIYFNIHNPQDSGFIYDYDDLIYPVPSQNASKQENGSYPIMSDVFHTQALFTDLYTQMEKDFKIYECQDEDLNMYYKSPMKYSNEGFFFFFFNNLTESQFLTTNPDEAHLFFVPFSSHRMKGNGPCDEKMAIVVQDFVQSLILKHPYWNRTQRANHFIVNCDSICWKATIRMRLLENAIQVLCGSLNALEFNPIKNIVLPGQEVQPFTHRPPGNIISKRKIRVTLADHSEDVAEFDRNFCSCPISQFHAACMVEPVLEGCVPVVSLSNPDLPFNDTLDWTKFSVIATEKDLPLQDIDKDRKGKHFSKLHSN